jgi:hypothetical protein
MRVDRGRLNWGIFFIVLAAVPLAYHQGFVSSSVLVDAWRLWPLILVGIGLGLVLSRTPAAFVGGLVVAAFLGLVLGSAFAVAPNVGCGGGGGHNASVTRDGSFQGPSSVNLHLQCGSATITASTDASWHVTASNDAGHTAQVSSDPTSLTVDSTTGNAWWTDRGKEDWQIALPQSGQISISSTLDAGDARYRLSNTSLSSASFTLNLGSVHVDLTGARVGNLSVSTNLGSAWVELDGSSDLVGDLKTNLGSLDVCAPADLGLRVVSTDSLSSSDFSALGMTRVGDAWQTGNYQTAAHKANLTVNTSLGSLKLHQAGGCK